MHMVGSIILQQSAESCKKLPNMQKHLILNFEVERLEETRFPFIITSTMFKTIVNLSNKIITPSYIFDKSIYIFFLMF
jgi:hypothetical protein